MFNSVVAQLHRGTRKSLQGVIKTSQTIIELTLRSLEDIFRTCCLRRATNLLSPPVQSTAEQGDRGLKEAE